MRTSDSAATGASTARDPFQNSADPSLYVSRPACERALDALQDGVEDSPEHPLLVAPPGYGKTLMLHVLTCRLAPNWGPVYLPYPMLPPTELCRWALLSLGVDEEPDPEEALLALAGLEEHPKGLVLLIDDADALPLETAARLFELSNASAGRLRLVLAAAPGEAADALAALEPIRRVEYETPLQASECVDYMRAKLRRLDPRRRAAFSPDRVHAIWRESDGCPGAIDLAAADLLLRRARETTGSASVPDRSPRTAVRSAGARPDAVPSVPRARERQPHNPPPVSPPPWREPPVRDRSRAEVWRFGLGAASGALIAIGMVGMADPQFFQRLGNSGGGWAGVSELEIAALSHEEADPPFRQTLPEPRVANAQRARAFELGASEALRRPAVSADRRVIVESEPEPRESSDREVPAVSSEPPSRPAEIAREAPVPGSQSPAALEAMRPVQESDRPLRETPAAGVTVEAPDGTLIEVAGRLFGPAPFRDPLSVPPGSQRFIARLPDGSVMMRRIDARDGARIVFYDR
ncbi:MAG: ATP-binding protein [Myxococcales bacterium]|nr:ATP-binding protein [Myxococcales bacterium]